MSRARGLAWKRSSRNGSMIVSIGECMVELTETGDGKLRRACGGDTYNTALYLARLSTWHGARVRFVTALGTDPISEWLVSCWTNEGIDVGGVTRIAGCLPGLYWVQVDDAGERRFLYWRSQSAARQLMGDDTPEAWARRHAGCAVVVLSGITLAILAPDARKRLLLATRILRSEGALVVFDPNYRPALWTSSKAARQWIASAVDVSDVVIMSTDDGRGIWPGSTAEKIFEEIVGRGAREVVIRDGSGPCIARAGGRSIEVSPKRCVRVVDTTAAGDSFNAGYIAARLVGHSIHLALRLGHSLAAGVIRHRGAITPRHATDRSLSLFERSIAKRTTSQ